MGQYYLSPFSTFLTTHKSRRSVSSKYTRLPPSGCIASDPIEGARIPIGTASPPSTATDQMSLLAPGPGFKAGFSIPAKKMRFPLLLQATTEDAGQIGGIFTATGSPPFASIVRRVGGSARPCRLAKNASLLPSGDTAT